MSPKNRVPVRKHDIQGPAFFSVENGPQSYTHSLTPAPQSTQSLTTTSAIPVPGRKGRHRPPPAAATLTHASSHATTPAGAIPRDDENELVPILLIVKWGGVARRQREWARSVTTLAEKQY